MSGDQETAGQDASKAHAPSGGKRERLVKSLVQHAAAHEPLRSRVKLLDEASSREAPVPFEFVCRAANAFLVSVIAYLRSQNTRRKGNLWVVCGDTRLMEDLESELLLWGERSLFLPELEIRKDLNALPDPDAQAQRLGVLQSLSDPTSPHAKLLILHEESLEEDVPKAQKLDAEKLTLSVGQQLSPEKLQKILSDSGFEKVPQIFQRGQFALRGGILDVFSWQLERPLRVEFFDDEIESLRSFDLHTQTSVEKMSRAQLLLRITEEKIDFCRVIDYLQPEDRVLAIACSEDLPFVPHGQIYEGARPGALEADWSVAFEESPLGVMQAGDFVIHQSKRELALAQLKTWHDERWKRVMFFFNDGERERYQELLSPAQANWVPLEIGNLSQGFCMPEAKLVVLSGAELFGRYQNERRGRHRVLDRVNQAAKEFGGDWVRHEATGVEDLSEGAYVVHLEYGIGKFRGLTKHEIAGQGEAEVLEIEYADEARLYVPVEHAFLIARYVAPGGRRPELSKLSDGKWSKARKQAERSIQDYASQLLLVHAERQTSGGIAHQPDGKWQWEFERSFHFRETEDQLRAIQETKSDMESTKPMDRLVCGDVGFGKTEVAIRAAFKCVMGGHQCAILAPTTVLAQQHYETFKERMSDYPVRVEVLSRFVSRSKQKETLKGLALGSVDIVIGTHRLVSQDVGFKNLGLVIIDEEQRFGVKTKEKFRELWRKVDVLTLSATPIPRTLYLSLTGVRDLSSIETPPINRFPVQTSVQAYDDRVIKAAIDRELKRGGQVYFLHNRVQTIDKVKAKIQDLCPQAKIGVGHGQMDEKMLEDVMHQFIAGKLDVLVCTTIIESGVNIPNANTILIDRADMFGLADLYQLRGRVGRSNQKAYAILLLPPHLLSTTDARRRIAAIRQHTSLGAGFKIAMRDLELRGVGNMLGTEQSGHLHAIGFDLYCQLLRQSVAKLCGKTPITRVDIRVQLDFICNRWDEHQKYPDRHPALIPYDYIEESRGRIAAYRRLASIQSFSDLNVLQEEWRDRYGRFPDTVARLIAIAEIKLWATQKKIDAVEVVQGKIMLNRQGKYLQIAGKFPRLESKDPDRQLREIKHWIQTEGNWPDLESTGNLGSSRSRVEASPKDSVKSREVKKPKPKKKKIRWDLL